MYHRLGKQFLSPTVNLWLSQPDFVEFCVHLDYYLSEDLVFLDTDKKYPVALLPGNKKDIPDIMIHFNHDKYQENAKQKWKERKRRIVKDNLYIMLYKLDGVTVEQLKRLESVTCKNKVVFSAVPLPDIPWSKCIRPNLRHQYPFSYLSKDIFGVRYIEKRFAFVSFLNS